METILNKLSVQKVQKIIKKYDSNLNVMVLKETARTASEAAKSLNCDVGAIVKSLLFQVDKNFLICLVSGDKRCSLNKLKKFLNKEDIYMANAHQVKENTGFSIGGVSPVGHIKKLDIIVDKSLNRFTNIFAAAGHPNCVFKTDYKNLIKMTNGHEKEITE